jgi:hypothetical protein
MKCQRDSDMSDSHGEASHMVYSDEVAWFVCSACAQEAKALKCTNKVQHESGWLHIVEKVPVSTRHA